MVTLSVIPLTGWLQTSRGLIGAKKPVAVYFRTRWGIHTFGMRFPIDVLILDNQLRVILLRHRLLPNRLFFWPPRYDLVIELPAGEIEKYRITPGDHIRIEQLISP